MTTGAALARDELASVADLYLDALGAGDPSRLPLAAGARYTENGQTLPFGAGMWASVDGEVTYRLVFADSIQGQVGAFAVVTENGLQGVMSIRLKVENSLITEAEALVARVGIPIHEPASLIEPPPVYLRSVAPSERVSREELMAIADSYFDAIEECGTEAGPSALPPVHEDCYRVENGHRTTGTLSVRELVATGEAARAEGFPAIRRMRVIDQLVAGCFEFVAAVRDRRHAIVDEERGLVLEIVLFDQPGTTKDFELAGLGSLELGSYARLPTTVMIAELFKIENGEIVAIEVVLNWFPYGMESGWD